MAVITIITNHVTEHNSHNKSRDPKFEFDLSDSSFSLLLLCTNFYSRYQPWAYDNTKLDQTQNGRHMFHILQELDADVCKCPFGAAGKEVGYSCPGTCLDYAYEHAG